MGQGPKEPLGSVWALFPSHSHFADLKGTRLRDPEALYSLAQEKGRWDSIAGPSKLPTSLGTTLATFAVSVLGIESGKLHSHESGGRGFEKA
eukprot:5591362-Alexandrium_andersonii.AAC.1